MNVMKCVFFCAMFVCLSVVSGAQDAGDSTTLAQATWKEFPCKDSGLKIKVLDTDVFGGSQRFFCVEIDPDLYEIEITQFEYLSKVKTTIRDTRTNAVAAINGGFFVTKIEEAIPVNFIKTNGVVHTSRGGRGGDAVAVRSDRRLEFSRWNAGDTLWERAFDDIIVAGPMILLDGVNLFPVKNDAGGRHPRSCIGAKSDGTIVMLVADGRRKNAVGLTFPELACLCRSLGMRSALNLDGGGSSTLWTRCKQIVNRPSDGLGPVHIERKVCNMISAVPK